VLTEAVVPAELRTKAPAALCWSLLVAGQPRNPPCFCCGILWSPLVLNPFSVFFPSLMDREVALLAEMDKVKAEASKAPSSH